MDSDSNFDCAGTCGQASQAKLAFPGSSGRSNLGDLYMWVLTADGLHDLRFRNLAGSTLCFQCDFWVAAFGRFRPLDLRQTRVQYQTRNTPRLGEAQLTF
jgi:hypothetical protein